MSRNCNKCKTISLGQ